MIKTNLEDYKKQIEAHMKTIVAASTKTIKEVASQMYEKIKDRTPVGDPSLWNWPAPAGYKPGTLKASWRISYSGKTGDVESKVGSISFTASNQFKDIVIYNEQPYAQRVETGWSTQAPNGMMRVTVNEFSSLLDKAASRNKL